jgi:hypothetical protein
MSEIILALDQGNIMTGFVVFNGEEILDMGKLLNHEILEYIYARKNINTVVIERFGSYGMPVGETTLGSVHWGGRFEEAGIVSGKKVVRIFRKDVKIALCGSMKAKDVNIRQALIDRFEPNLEANKRPKGILKDVSKDMWSALALAVVYLDGKANI